jgi:hypothetical protein
MIKLSSTQFLGSPSPLATAQVVSEMGFCVVFAVSGPDSAAIAKQAVEKLKHSQVDSPSSFLSLIERVQEQWSEAYGEISAIFPFEDKMYLLVQNGEIWLRRGEKFGRVLKGADELKVVEGRIQDQDAYIVMTQSASVAVAELLPQVIDGRLNFDDMQRHIQTSIDSSGLSDRSAIQVVGVSMTDVVPVASDGASAKAVQLNEYVQKIGPVLKQLLEFSKKVAKQIPPAIEQLKQLRNNQLTREQRKKIALALLVVGLIGAVIIGFTIMRSVQTRRGRAFLAPFEDRLLLLEQTAIYDVVSARDQVLVLQKEFETQRSLLKNNLFARSSLNAFSKQLSTFVTEISGKVELQSLPIFYDFRLVQSDYLASRADTDQNTAVFLDLGNQSATAIFFDTKQQIQLPIGQYPVLKDMSFSADQVYILADGVYRYALDGQSEARKIIPEGDSNRDGSFVRVFGDFVYVFNSEKRNIYRYAVSNDNEDEQPQPIGWFQDKKDFDFPSVSSFAIDGSVWLGTHQGKVLKYERGNPVQFEIQGMHDPFETTLKVYTKEELDSIFVLEAAKNRVVRLTKDGFFVRQIESPSLGAATDVFFSTTTNQAYAVAGSLVYELAL